MLCDGGDITKPTDAGNRHSMCPNDMARDMEAGTFKRVTFRFQGGTGGLPNAKTGNEAVAAAVQVTPALDSVHSKAAKLKKQQKAEKRKLKNAAARESTADDVEPQAEYSDDEQGEELQIATPKVLSIAKRPARQSQLATREQRRGVTFVLALQASKRKAPEGTAVLNSKDNKTEATWTAPESPPTKSSMRREKKRARRKGRQLER